METSAIVKPYIDPKMSYVYGKSNQNLSYDTVGTLLDEIAQREPHSTAIVSFAEGISKSYEEFNHDVNRLVKGLVDGLKLEKGESVGIYSYNNYQWVLVQFACLRLGLPLIPINPSYKAHELSYILSQGEIKTLFVPGLNSSQAAINNHWNIVQGTVMIADHKAGHIDNLKHIILLDGDQNTKFSLDNVNVYKWQQVFDNDGVVDKSVVKSVSPDDIYAVYFTSGTTGFPKGATLTQNIVLNNASLASARVCTLTRGRTMRPNVCLPLPLFHCFAGVLGALIPLSSGGSFVLTGARYNITSVVQAIMKFSCNTMMATPTILIDLLAHIEAKKMNNLPLQTLIIAGAPVMAELVHRAHKLLPKLDNVQIAYGASETGPIITCQTIDEPPETRPYTVGPPLDFIEVRIVDINSGETVPFGHSGEVQTRGHNTMIGYYRDPTRTREAFAPGRWYRTGDLGILDKHGSLQIVGRIKDMIIKGGENVYPAEVEHILHGHEAIEDAHVVGVPDQRYGEEICAWVKLKQPHNSNSDSKKLSEKDIMDFCKEKLTYFKVPRYVLIVDEFPMTPTKKVKKFEMRDMSIKMLNLKK
ncbi:Medium-chain acyl-CoA ligase ACSF2, mitochondrial [Fragariocoptes setiger]|uniref:Medium-chain acyl-CoA ligase ACSF2, mitochondrial n=1 Tax=Fragariocoptes setiger TaxID=1670756 RepID=A0ABQ7SC70_9ACAR|nr:Medium-chain acyl-CoA ligase ACSF2, mitochondrial [Fragariocoptes setiger]